MMNTHADLMQVKKKKSFHGRFRTPRTRSGCLRCRRRKLKCDEQKPRCVRCCGSNRSCQYGLKFTWKDEPLSKKVMLRRRGSIGVSAVESQLRRPRVVHFLNTNTDDLLTYARNEGASVPIADTEITEDEYDDADNIIIEEENHKDIAHACSSPMLRPSLLRCSQLELSSTDSILLEFYINRMCSTCTLLDGKDNGYKHVIIPILLNSSLLMRSVLAVSANHLRFQDTRYHVTALQYRGSTLRSLQRLISNPGKTSKSELLSTILMLCFFDISDGCQSDWTKHLKGARQVMMQPYSSPDAHSATEVITFLAQYFASHSIMAYTALADPRKEKSLKAGGKFWLKQIIRPEQEIDAIVGCSKELMGIILDISSRVRDARNPRISMCSEAQADQITWKQAMDLRLQTLQQTVPSSPHTTSISASRLQYTAEAFRDAALLLLQYLDPQPPSLSASRTRQWVTDILFLLEKCPINPSGSRSSSLWPLFIAACHVENDEERLLLLGRFHNMESRKRFGNIKPVREVVEWVWRRSDLRSNDNGRKDNGNGIWKGSFEWEDAMALLGSNLSLT